MPEAECRRRRGRRSSSGVVRRDEDEMPQLVFVLDLVADEFVAALGFGSALVLKRELRLDTAEATSGR